MLEIIGNYNSALVYTDNIEAGAKEQIKNLCDQEFVSGSKIRIMPDVHSGMGCTIGTTMTIKDKIVPNLVGVDIGCGLEVVKLANDSINLKKLDEFIYKRIPSGFNIRKKAHYFADKIDLNELHCKGEVDLKRAILSIGTLGGGNHFIEMNHDSDENLYLVVHSGSRHLGHEVATLYQRKAERDIGAESNNRNPLAYIQGKLYDDYLHDMKIIQRFAELNRQAIIDEIVHALDLDITEQFTTVHNYIDIKYMILRKGAVSAQKGEKLIIPLNMRDGSLICIGKGNPDWNYSAPHGAGRIMSRTQARKLLELSNYQKMMKEIYTTSVNKKTLDECPEAYKPFDEIINNIQDTVDIVERIVPIYNFKAAE